MDTETEMAPEIPKGRISIEQATPADVPGIVRVRKESWRDTYPNEANGISKESVREYTERFDHPEEIEKRQRNWEDNQSWVAKEGDRIVGFIHVVPEQNEVAALYVRPDYLNVPERKLDIGKRLVEQALEHLDDAQEVVVWVAAYNAKAIRFYQKMGFAMTERKKSHHLIGQEVEMVRPTSS